jgi:ABC-type thiamin/hydroxymethylpyrimidine transport system permease subunit
MKILAIVLIVAGVLALVYGGFSYISDSHTTKLGPLKLTVQDKERVNIPIWAGVGAIAVGAALLLFGNKKS